VVSLQWWGIRAQPEEDARHLIEAILAQRAERAAAAEAAAAAERQVRYIDLPCSHRWGGKEKLVQ